MKCFRVGKCTSLLPLHRVVTWNDVISGLHQRVVLLQCDFDFDFDFEILVQAGRKQILRYPSYLIEHPWEHFEG